MCNCKPFLLASFLLMNSLFMNGQEEAAATVIPHSYERALKNPLKGFTTNSIKDHPWGTLAHTYIRWNEIENHESDGIDKIINFCNQKWNGIAEDNIKVIPRVYLHWDGDKKYWPSDLQDDDYTSEQFQERVLRLIERLGVCWDNDPRIAFIELGIFGKWGEHHSPAPTAQMQKIVADAFAEAFKNKKISVRHFWSEFTDQPFGEYWDSWGHYNQMFPHGNRIKQVNETGRYKSTYIGGEVAYGWGDYEIQPGASPTASVSIKQHRDFVINSIRWLHCTQLRWIAAYDKNNSSAKAGAEEMQKAFGYRYEINEFNFSMTDSLKVSFDVSNTGSAPFYYEWPVELALLDPETLEPVWKSTMDSVDIRNWLPGDGWTDPEWEYVGGWSQYNANVDWISSGESGWAIAPAVSTVEDKFKLDLPDGSYILSLAILDPAGDVPAIRFATANYLNGGRHPMGILTLGENTCDTLPGNFQFDDPYTDQSLYYEDDFEIDYIPDPVQVPYKGSSWRFPGDTVEAWQYDYIFYDAGERFFSLDSENTIGIYGCDDQSGQNVRNYMDSALYDDAAQFKWNPETETFQKHGQWLKYTADFKIKQAYQLLLRARNNLNSDFNLTIYSELGDTVMNMNISPGEEFETLGGGNAHTDWYISKFSVGELWGIHTIRFDWNENIGEAGVFGAFSFVGSDLDVTPPEWYFISIGTLTIGTDIVLMTNEAGMVYLVPMSTAADTASILNSAVSAIPVSAYNEENIATSDLEAGDYILYAMDESMNVSEPSRLITLEAVEDTSEINAVPLLPEEELQLKYSPTQNVIFIRSNKELSKVIMYDILGNLLFSREVRGSEVSCQLNTSYSGVCLIRVQDKNGKIYTRKVVISSRSDF